MYFPYFRGKQYEWLALRETCQLITPSNKIIPIIEPVKKNLSTFHRSFDVFKKNRMPFIIVSNPQVGEFAKENSILIKELKKLPLRKLPHACISYVISNNSEISDIRSFFRDFKGFNICLIHDYHFSSYKDVIKLISSCDQFKYNIFIDENTGNRYRRRYRNYQKVLIEDGFRNRRNEDYPPEEFFSDLHLEYENEGCKGFGDYLIVGNKYSETGGPAYAVAIHLTYLNDEDEIWIKHFVSDTKGTPVDPAGKFLEALEKLVKYIQSGENEIFESNSIIEFIDLYRREHFPGLGYVKKLSMKHHIELINNTIK